MKPITKEEARMLLEALEAGETFMGPEAERVGWDGETKN